MSRVSQRPLLAIPELMVGFDTETTGLEISTQRAISYGFTAYMYGVPVWEKQFFVIPDVEMSPGAQRVHGLSLEDLEAKRATETVLGVATGAQVAAELLEYFHGRGATIVGLNVVGFDIAMLRETLRTVVGEVALQRYSFDRHRIIDVRAHDLLIEPSRAERPRRGLEPLCGHYGITPGGHDALADARATVEVLLAQIEFNQRTNSVTPPFPLEISPRVREQYENFFTAIVRGNVDANGRLAQSGSALA